MGLQDPTSPATTIRQGLSVQVFIITIKFFVNFFVNKILS